MDGNGNAYPIFVLIAVLVVLVGLGFAGVGIYFLLAG